MVNVGLIGRNFVVDWLLAAAEQVPDFRAVGIYSRTEEGARAFAEKYALRHTFTRLEDMARCPEIDAVYIASPICCHYAQAKLMLEHGKHVLCEKPVTTSAWEVEELVALAKARGLVFLEAMRLVFDDALPVIRQNLPRIGRVHFATFEFSRYSSRYDAVRAGQACNTFDPALSNAAIMDIGCYCIHGLVSLFGAPSAVYARSTFLENGFEGSGIVRMDYPDFTAQAIYSKVVQQVRPSAITGEDGSILLDDINHLRRIWLEPRQGAPEDLAYREKLPNNMMFELREFCRCIEAGEQPARWNQDSIHTMRVIDEARRQAGIRFPADRA